ncbi:MAG TPA: hypothetical protein VGR87_15410 [Candidatus Limnocylindria bacterium]|nr:hypothetical protein [Candidatus Limnocylindria bacterium]
MFNKATITRSLAADEPMVTLDAAAITQRIGSISHPPKPEAVQAPIYQALATRAQPTEAKWRRALRPRPVS